MADSMENPSPIPTVPLAYYAQPYALRRPILLLIIAWMAIVLGSFALLGLIGSVIGLIVSHAMNNGAMFEFHGNGIFIDNETMVMNLISSVAGIALFVGGLKTLRLRPIGRTILIWYCMFTLAFSVINAVMTYNLIKSAMTSGIANATSANLGPPPELFEIIVGVVFTYAIAGSILYYLTRSSIKNLFEDTLFLSERRVPGANS